MVGLPGTVPLRLTAGASGPGYIPAVEAGEVRARTFFYALRHPASRPSEPRSTDLGLELVDLRLGGTPNRPLVQVRIEWPGGTPARGVTVDDCARASRALEAWLDGDGSALGSRYVLEVSSPGMDRPLRWPRHWVRFVGRDVQCTAARAWGGCGARIVAVPDEATVVLQPEGREPLTLPLAAAREARLAVDW